ncbi:MAG: menaquinone biosynthesis decarboxylase [Rikenellaceae bacterium]
MYKNLANFITLLESTSEVKKIATEVNPDKEISEIVDRMSKEPGGGSALLFESSGTEFPVLCNMMGSERRMALALGLNSLDEVPGLVADLLGELKKPRKTLFDKLSILPVLGKAGKWFPKHSKRRGECQSVIYRDGEVDLSILPILKTWPHDGGRFVTLPLVNTVDPENGETNLGMYRMQVIDKKTTAMHWHIHKTGANHYEKYKTLGKRMPVAVCLGGDPAITYAATAPLPEGIDEYILAGFLRKKPVKLVKCITCDLEVPSSCDIVIEGYVDPMEEKFIEGPFGDHTGFYSLKDRYPLFHVTAITHRKGAVYPTTLVGVPPMEDRYIAEVSEKIFAEPIKAVIAPEITSLRMPWQGVAHNLAVVAIKKNFDAQGLKVASALWGAGQMSFCKIIWIAERDYSDTELQSILLRGTKFTAEVVLNSGVADVLEHASEEIGRGGKMCVDTTSSKAREWQITVKFDTGVESLNDDEKMWLLLANVDPSRDVIITEGSIEINAQSKKLQERDFPNIVTMDDATISKVDSRWEEYNIGEFIPSPSLRYKKLIKGDAAEQQF